MMSMLAGSSVEALCKRAPGTGAPVEAIVGGASLGAHMETYGFSAVPSLANKDPAKALQAAGVSARLGGLKHLYMQALKSYFRDPN